MAVNPAVVTKAPAAIVCVLFASASNSLNNPSGSAAVVPPAPSECAKQPMSTVGFVPPVATALVVIEIGIAPLGKIKSSPVDAEVHIFTLVVPSVFAAVTGLKENITESTATPGDASPLLVPP